MTNFSQPTNTTLVSTVLDILRERDESIAQMDYSDDTNIGAGFVRYNRMNRSFEEWSGSAWVEKRTEPAGIIKQFAGTSAPRGHVMCDGLSYPKTDTTYAALYAVIGGTYGETATHFSVPDLQGRFPLGKATTGTGSTLGGTGGALDHIHSVPAHHHAMGTGSDLAISSSGGHTTTIDISHGHTATTSKDSANVSIADNKTGSHTVSLTDNQHSHGVSLTARSGAGNTATTTILNSYVSAGSTSYAFTNGSTESKASNITLNHGTHTHAVTITDTTHNHAVTVAGLDSPTNRTDSSGTHTHASSSISGKIGLVTGGVDGNAAMTSGPQNPAFIALNYVITL